MDLYNILIEYGLREKQARVYLACLEVGSAPILKIARQAGLARSTTELELEALLDRGLVSSFKKKRIRYFSADDPHTIVNSLKDKTELIQRFLPKFMALYGSNKQRPSVRFYEGKSGMKLILNEILSEAKEILCFSSAEDLFGTIEEFSEFVKQRVKAKIPIKVILRNTEKAQERKQLGPSELRQVKLISKDFEYHGLIYIWNEKIAMFSFKGDFVALAIESKELAQVQRSLFSALWQGLA